MQERQDRQRSICFHDFFGGGTVLLEHLLDEIDPPSWTIELVAEQNIGRTRRCAKAAMDAFAQDIVGFGDVRVLELGQGEMGLHRSDPRIDAARVQHAFWIETVLNPGCERLKRWRLWMKRFDRLFELAGSPAPKLPDRRVGLGNPPGFVIAVLQSSTQTSPPDQS